MLGGIQFAGVRWVARHMDAIAGRSDARLAGFRTELKSDIADLKGDLAGFRTDLKNDIAELRTELKNDIADLRTELKNDIADLRTELKNDIAELRADLKNDIAELRADLKNDIADVRAELTDVKHEFDVEKRELSDERVWSRGGATLRATPPWPAAPQSARLRRFDKLSNRLSTPREPCRRY
ncbi:MAG: apolipoprotein A1/A4/E family protein [Actinobacteria bacterium]|nr:apolipoprotein A1/A4/E family protein [Actinomycetota bacterium]